MEEAIKNFWEYYLIIDRDMKIAMRYIDPRNQKDVFSFEFAKNIVLACTECESIFKKICELKTGKEKGNIGEYKKIILKEYPNITTVDVFANGMRITPFSGWEEGVLDWWNSYTSIKHNRSNDYKLASFLNAANAVGALYILNLYLSKITEISIHSDESVFIDSNYGKTKVFYAPIKELPDF